MRRKLETVKRELRATGTVADRDAYRSLMNVRAKVNERYGEAITGYVDRAGKTKLGASS